MPKYYDENCSLIYNASARHEQHECDTSDTNATWVRHKRHEWNTSDTSATQTTKVWHEWKILILITTEVKTFSHAYIYYMASERKEQFRSKNYLFEMPRFYAKIRSKRAPQKLNILMAKAISKSCTLDCLLQIPLHVPA